MNFQQLLTSVCRDNPSHESVKEFIALCRRIAVVHLRKKVTTRRLRPEFFSLPIEDIALDCIADLFQQSDHGSLYQVRTYFEGVSYQKASEEELLSHIRRLIFSKVNQGLFRLYNDADPSLGKIVRNIKLSLQSLHNFVVLVRFGEQYLAPAMCDTLEHLPPIDRADLARHLWDASRNDQNIPTLLADLSRCLRDQNSHSRLVPFMEIAFAIRTLYGSPADLAVDVAPEDRFTADDARRIITETCEMIHREMRVQYVEKKRVACDVFQKYFLVIRQNLEARIIGHDGELFSFFDRLQEVVPGLSKDEYQQHHKSKIEYLGRLTHERAIRELRKQYR